MPNASPFRFTLPTRLDEQPTTRPRTKPLPPSQVSQFKQKGLVRFQNIKNSFPEAARTKHNEQATADHTGNGDHNEHHNNIHTPKTPTLAASKAPRQFKVPLSVESLNLEANQHKPSTQTATEQPQQPIDSNIPSPEQSPTHQPDKNAELTSNPLTKPHRNPPEDERTTPSSSPSKHIDKRRRLEPTPTPRPPPPPPPSTFRPLPSFSFSTQPQAQHSATSSQALKRPAFRSNTIPTQATQEDAQQPHDRLPLPPDLALLFSPRKSNRHGDQFLAGGWAEQVRSWIIDTPASFSASLSSEHEPDPGAAGKVVRIDRARSSVLSSGEDDTVHLVSRNRSEITPFTLVEGTVIELSRQHAKTAECQAGENLQHVDPGTTSPHELEHNQSRKVKLVLLSPSSGASDLTNSYVRLGSGARWQIDLLDGGSQVYERWWVYPAGWKTI